MRERERGGERRERERKLEKERERDREGGERPAYCAVLPTKPHTCSGNDIIRSLHGRLLCNKHAWNASHH